MLADIDLGRHPPIGGSDSGTRIEFYQLTVGIQTSSFNMLRPGLYPSLCPKMVEIGPVVFEILIFLCFVCWAVMSAVSVGGRAGVISWVWASI